MGRRLLPILSGALLVFFVYESAVRTLLAPFVALPDLAGGIAGQTIILVLFSVLHSTSTLGFRHTVVFFLATAVISWTFEQVGVATGVIYGAYHYTDVPGREARTRPRAHSPCVVHDDLPQLVPCALHLRAGVRA